MAETTHYGERPVDTAVLDGAVEDYPTNRKYVYVAIFLAAVTVVEVLTYVSEDFVLWGWGDGKGLVTVLLLLMAVKFWTVAWYFMHLRWDSRLLTYVFYSGLVLALLVYLAVMTAFRLWWPGAHS